MPHPACSVQFPKIKALDLKNDASITTKSSWELSGERESGTIFSESQTDTVTCKATLAPKTWSQIRCVQYQGTLWRFLRQPLQRHSQAWMGRL